MRYDDPTLQDRLAAEYVLGTLEGAARRRFERLLEHDSSLRDHVEAWERRLGPLADAVPPLDPPERAWQGIERRLALGAVPRHAAEGPWNRVDLWRGVAAAAGVAALALGLYVTWAPPGAVSDPEAIAVVQDAEREPAWVLHTDTDAGTVRVTALGDRRAPDGKVYELWLIPPGDDAEPRSCGLLPAEGSTRMQLTAEERRMLPQVRTVGVSVEPEGGSPTGRPTGPLIYRGAIHPAG